MWLRQSTASQEVLLGPFLDSTDGNTAETGLTIANTDIKIWKEGGTTESNKNSGGATHIAGGRYYAVLDATDTNTLGKLEINCHPTGALAVRREFMVLPANVYDSLVLGTDDLDVQVSGIDANAITAASIASSAITSSKVATDAIGSTQLAASAVTEIQTGLATSAEITALNDISTADVNAEVDLALADYDPPTNTEMVAAFTEIKGSTWSVTDTLESIRDEQVVIDGNVDSVKTKTDQMVYTKANELDVNVQSMNDATILGDGTSLDKWRG